LNPSPQNLELAFASFKYLENQIFGKGANQIHSPFVFEFYNEVLQNPYNFYCFEAIEKERESLLVQKDILQYQDLGANPKTIKRKISNLAASSLMSPEEGQILFRLTRWLNAKTILELGSSLGITTSYLAKGSDGMVYSFEGIPEIASVANKSWNHLNIKNIEQELGKIELKLPEFLASKRPRIDLAVVDANHRYSPTLNNFEQLLPHLHNDSCIVFHDIYWSKEMARAWDEIRCRPEVRLSIDFYKMGLVFFRKESTMEHFNIRW